MEDVQMTIDDWLEIKDRIRRELNNVKHSFVRVGFYLRKVRDEKLYLQDGYSSLSEFAKAEFNMGASFVSRMISINEKFSLDGYSEQMDPRYEDFKQGALTEMLALPDSDMEMITPATPREDIRELKRFNAQEPAAEPEAGDEHSKILEVVEEFCRQNRQLISDLYEYTPLTATAEKDLIEMINPSGSRTFKKGLYFVSFTDTVVKIKKFMKPPQDMSYAQFVDLITEVLGFIKTGHNWEDHFGWPEDDRKPAENAQKPAESAQKPKESAQKPKESVRNEEKQNDEKGTEGPSGEDGDEAGEDHKGASEAEEGAGGIPDNNRHSDDGQDQDTGGQDRPDRSETGGHDQDTASGEIQAAGGSETEEQEETQVEGLAPAQLEVAGMNEPEDSAPDGYDLHEIRDMLEAIEDSIENRNWLTAEAACNELAAYLARCRGGGSCS